MALFIEAGFTSTELSAAISMQVDIVGPGDSFLVTIAGTYFLRTSAAAATGDYASQVTGYTDFLTALQDALNAGATGTPFTVTFSTTTELMTITHDGSSAATDVQLTSISVPMQEIVGFNSASKSGTLIHIGENTPFYWIKGDIGFWSEMSDDSENDDDVAIDQEAHDGTPYGIAKNRVSTYMDMEVPLEERTKVHTRKAPATKPWTWQDFYPHVRNLEPVAIDDGDEIHFVRLRDKGAAFIPQRITSNYIGHWNIPLLMRVLART